MVPRAEGGKAAKQDERRWHQNQTGSRPISFGMDETVARLGQGNVKTVGSFARESQTRPSGMNAMDMILGPDVPNQTTKLRHGGLHHIEAVFTLERVQSRPGSTKIHHRSHSP